MSSYHSGRLGSRSKSGSRHGGANDDLAAPSSLAVEESGSALLLEKAATIHRTVHNVLSSAQSLVSRTPVASRNTSVRRSGAALAALSVGEGEDPLSEPPSGTAQAAASEKMSTASTIGNGSSLKPPQTLFEEDRRLTESSARSITASTWLLADRAEDSGGQEVVVAHSSDALTTIVQRLSGADVRTDLKDKDKDLETLQLLLRKARERAEGQESDVETAGGGWNEYFFRQDTGLLDMAEYQSILFDQAHRLIRGMIILFVALLLVDMIVFALLLYKNIMSRHDRLEREVLSVINIVIDTFGLAAVHKLSRRSARPLEYFLLLSLLSILCTSLMYGHPIFVLRVLYVLVTMQLLGYVALNSYGRFQLNVAQEDRRSRFASYVILLTPRGEHAAACRLSC